MHVVRGRGDKDTTGRGIPLGAIQKREAGESSGANQSYVRSIGCDQPTTAIRTGQIIMRDLLHSALTALMLAACAAPASGPRVANNPCEDPQYLALKAQPVDSLSEREYQQLQQGNTACAQVAAVLAASADDESRRPPRHLDTDAWTQAMANESGSEIHIRNKSPVAIIVTEITLTTCINLADPCGTHRPRVRIEPGSARRVLRLRYGTGLAASTFAYTYRVEPADPERN